MASLSSQEMTLYHIDKQSNAKKGIEVESKDM